MATFFYDGQIRRYLLQVIRLLSNFVVRYSDGTLVRVPVVYADPDRQVANILNQNSESAVISAPRIAVYITDLELDTTRLSDSSFIGKISVRERALSADGTYYENNQGSGYTIERLMPTPYKLTLKVDIWTTNTDQKLQLLEQILMLFNPSLEIQTTDNYIDWTSLSVVDLVQTSFSSKSVPVGTNDAIDIATLTLSTPIYISPPAKVKKLGVITSLISNILTDVSDPYGNYVDGLGQDPSAGTAQPYNLVASKTVTVTGYTLEVTEGKARLHGFNNEIPSWLEVVQTYSGDYKAGLSRIYLKQENGSYVIGSFSISPLNTAEIVVNWDSDTYPSNEHIPSSYRTSTTTFDAIIDPQKTGPGAGLPAPVAGTRYLILEDINGGIKDTFVSETRIQRINTNVLHRNVEGHKVFVNGVEVSSGSLRIPDNLETGNYYILLDELAPANSVIKYEIYVNSDGPDAWKNSDGSDFIAGENDVIEWTGNKWTVVFDAKENQDQLIYLTNIFTGTQYKWNGVNWSKSFEGDYKQGEWKLEL